MLINKLANTFHSPFTYELFFSVRYIENIHLYFWMLKDLAWSLDYRDFGMVFGTIAVLWLGVLYWHACKKSSTEELYFLIPTTLWLFGNFIWMTGELIYNNDNLRPLGADCMLIGIILVMFYHIFVKWLGMMELKPNLQAEKMYNENGMKSRFKYFATFRQYEHFHTFCWLGKDLCWNTNFQLLWGIFVLPTFFISGDFIFLTWNNPKMTIDMCHYIAQFMWVSANIIWAYGELFEINVSDNPQYLIKPNQYTFRWTSSLILTLAWIPIVILYFLWIPLTYYKKISHQNTEPNQIEITTYNVILNNV